MGEIDGNVINFVTENDETLLFEAVRVQHKDTIEWLIEMGLDPHSINSYGDTTYHLAVKYSVEELGFYIEETDYNGGTANSDQDTPLLIAVKSGQAGWVPLLASYDDINQQNSMGWTPLMFAVDFGFADIVSELVDAGADTEIQNEQGNTAISIAEEWGNEEVLEALN